VQNMRVRTIGIRGAGLSGLSVARELRAIDPQIAITLFDIRPRLPHPVRTFCFFNRELRSATELGAFSWKTVMFRGSSFERRLDVSGHPYTMVRGDDFFSSTLQELEHDGVECVWGCESVEISGNSIRAGSRVHAFDAVIDAAFDVRTARAKMWQSFAGVWVTTEKSVFDPSAAVLMDLQESRSDCPVRFLYILPTSERTALVEHTAFSPTLIGKEEHMAQCAVWLQSHDTGELEYGDSEYGLIPMGLSLSPNGGTPVVGSIAGAVRPSTGYAFVRTQEHARRVAASILGNATQASRPYPRWMTMADSLFLQSLVNLPERGRDLMEHFLSRSRSDALVAFLSGDVSLLEALSVWLSVPKRLMIRSLLRI
jgi:lycopene beta-cyclase